jgi:hypothetical protein
MYTTSDIYNRLDDINHTPQDKTTSTTSSPSISMRSLSEIWDNFPTIQSNTIATGTTIMGITGTLYGDIDPSKVLTTATYPGTATAGTPALEWQTPDPNIVVCPGPWDSSWSGGTPDTCLTGGANDYCQTTLGADWRLPSVGELIDAFLTGIPGSFTGGNYYSSSGPLVNTNIGGEINPFIFYPNLDENYSIRCVR